MRAVSRRRFLAGAGAACAAAAAGPAEAVARSESVAERRESRSGGSRVAQSDVEERIDDLVESALDEHGVPGATVAVVADGEVALTKGYGVADSESGRPVDAAETAFRVGSVSKPVVATALLRRIARGDLEPDADVGQYLDGIDVREGTTLRRLVTHRAGFEYSNRGLWITPDGGVRSLASYLREEPQAQVRPPGEVGSYSNYGFALAGSVLAAARDEPFHRAIDAELLEPAGMTTSSFRQPLPEDLADAHATGYQLGQPSPAGSFPYCGLRPAGALSTTAADMARFLQLHLNGGVVDGEQVLAAETVDAIHRQWATHHESLPGDAFGFVERPHGDVRTLWHNGATPSFYGELLLVPERDLGLFVAFNSQSGAAGRDVREGFLDAFLPAPDEESLTPDGRPSRADELTGQYRSLNVAETWHDKVSTTLQASTVEVRVADDGALVTASGGGTERWVEVEPLVFERVDGRQRLAFGEGSDGVAYLFDGGNPTTAFGRVEGIGRLALHGALALATVIGLLSAVLGWPAAAAVRWLRSGTGSMPSPRDPATLPRLVAGGSAAALLGFVALGFAHLLAASYAVLSDPPLTFTALFALPLLGAVGTAASTVWTVQSWRAGRWGLIGRLHYALVAASLIGACWLLWYWNLLVPPL